MITYAFTGGKQEWAFTTDISTKANAINAYIPSSHNLSITNGSFTPFTVMLNVAVTTNYYLVNFDKTLDLAAAANSASLPVFNLGYLSIIKID